MHTRALYAGTFDPLTLGHLDLIKRASCIFDELVVGVTVNMEKSPMFSFEERMEMIKNEVSSFGNVSVDKCEGLLAEYVNSGGFNVVVRGLRSGADFDNEQSMDQLHKHLYNEGTQTVYLISDSRFAFISSTMARQVVSLGGDGTVLVPSGVLKKMKLKLNLK